MTKTLKIPLPKIIEGKREIELSEPTFNDYLRMAQEIGQETNELGFYLGEIKLLSEVSGISIESLDELPVSILQKSITFLKSFENKGGRTAKNPAASKEILLDAPISVDKSDYQSLSLREPTVRERIRMKEKTSDEATPETTLMAYQSLLIDVSGWPLAAVRRLPISKFWEAVNYLISFFLIGLEIGET